MNTLSKEQLKLLKEFDVGDEPRPIVIGPKEIPKWDMIQNLYKKGLIDGSRFTMVNGTIFLCGYLTDEGKKVLTQ